MNRRTLLRLAVVGAVAAGLYALLAGPLNLTYTLSAPRRVRFGGQQRLHPVHRPGPPGGRGRRQQPGDAVVRARPGHHLPARRGLRVPRSHLGQADLRIRRHRVRRVPGPVPVRAADLVAEFAAAAAGAGHAVRRLVADGRAPAVARAELPHPGPGRPAAGGGPRPGALRSPEIRPRAVALLALRSGSGHERAADQRRHHLLQLRPLRRRGDRQRPGSDPPAPGDHRGQRRVDRRLAGGDRAQRGRPRGSGAARSTSPTAARSARSTPASPRPAATW